jgi:hypothetical protein
MEFLTLPREKVLAGTDHGGYVALSMKNEYEEFKDLVSSRNERVNILSANEAREEFWLNVMIWLVLLGLMLFGLIAVIWLFFFY